MATAILEDKHRGVDYRTFSRRVAGDSKALEKVEGAVVRLLGSALELPPTARPKDGAPHARPGEVRSSRTKALLRVGWVVSILEQLPKQCGDDLSREATVPSGGSGGTAGRKHQLRISMIRIRYIMEYIYI